jgi:L-ascorbate metabolism protein UlaG (beta-lactamase superfamily)
VKIQLIRNATLRLHYAGCELLIDPYFAPKFSRPSYTGASLNPLVELPSPPAAIMAGVELVIISHLHSDHFDPEAQRLLPKALPILCQPGDEMPIRAHGFQQVTPIISHLRWKEMVITRTPGQHGQGAVLAEMGHVSGFVFQAPQEPTIYWAGDTIWCKAVQAAINHFRPLIIITHSCGAVWGKGTLIVMDAAQTVTVCQAAPTSTIIATHMDALDHAQVSRAALRAYAQAAGISDFQLLIPADGHSFEWDKDELRLK